MSFVPYISLNPLLSEVHGGGQAVLLLRVTPSLTTWVELFGHQRVRANNVYGKIMHRYRIKSVIPSLRMLKLVQISRME